MNLSRSCPRVCNYSIPWFTDFGMALGVAWFALGSQFAFGCSRSKIASHGAGTLPSTMTTMTVGAVQLKKEAPRIFYTDIVSGPTLGGENNKGTYLSIFGTNFGKTGLGSTVKVYINNVEVDNYRYLGKCRARTDIQQIVVQVGALGNPVPGRALPIKVVVNDVASNDDLTFTVQPGDIRFVSLHGDDSTAIKNDVKHPWRYVQTPSLGGALGLSNPGDTIVLRGGVNETWADLGFDTRWFRFRHSTGNEPTGKKGHGYVAILSYPGEDVHYVAPPDTNGGIHGVGDNEPESSDWIVVSGLHIESVATSRRDAAPINLQIRSDHWRIVNNELGPWSAPVEAHDRSGGLAGSGEHVAIMGNQIHDIGGGTENHGIYIDNSSNDVEISYNVIHDIVSGNLIQTYDTVGATPIDNVKVHHNLLYNGGRYALNLSEGTHSCVVWNNVIYNVAMAGVRFNVYDDHTANFAILHNTIASTNRVGTAMNAPIANDGGFSRGVAIIKNNIIVTDQHTQGKLYFAEYAAAPAMKFERNLWYGRGLGSALHEDSTPVGGNTDRNEPKFANWTAHNFALTEKSPARDQATSTTPFNISDDFQGKARPLGAKSDVGAYEY